MSTVAAEEVEETYPEEIRQFNFIDSYPEDMVVPDFPTEVADNVSKDGVMSHPNLKKFHKHLMKHTLEVHKSFHMKNSSSKLEAILKVKLPTLNSDGAKILVAKHTTYIQNNVKSKKDHPLYPYYSYESTKKRKDKYNSGSARVVAPPHMCKRNPTPIVPITPLSMDENSLQKAVSDLSRLQHSEENNDNTIVLLLSATRPSRSAEKLTMSQTFEKYPIFKTHPKWIYHEYWAKRIADKKGGKNYAAMLESLKDFIECFALYIIRDTNSRVVNIHDELIKESTEIGTPITEILKVYRTTHTHTRLQSTGPHQLLDNEAVESQLASFTNADAIEQLVADKQYNLLVDVVLAWIFQYQRKRKPFVITKVPSMAGLSRNRPFIAVTNRSTLGDYDKYSVIIDGVVVVETTCAVEALLMYIVCIELYNIANESIILHNLFSEVVAGISLPVTDFSNEYKDLKRDIGNFFEKHNQYTTLFPVDAILFASLTSSSLKETPPPVPVDFSVLPPKNVKKRAKKSKKKAAEEEEEEEETEQPKQPTKRATKKVTKKVDEPTETKGKKRKAAVGKDKLKENQAKKAKLAVDIPDSFDDDADDDDDDDENAGIQCTKCQAVVLAEEYCACHLCTQIYYCADCSKTRLRICSDCDKHCCSEHGKKAKGSVDIYCVSCKK